MNNSNISFANAITIDETATLIQIVGSEITAVVQGEPGTGKSTLLQILKQRMGDAFHYVYVDCPIKDVGDVAMNIPVHGTKTLEHYLSELFPRDGKPLVVMLDEFMKSPKMLQILWTRLMLERYVGDWALPAGSIVFATSNNQSDGVGDTMLAHAGNRVCIVKMQKPDTETWLNWATANGVSALTRAWVAMNKRCLASYTDGGQDENPYIFNPARPMLSFVSPRSLFKCDTVVRKRNALGENATRAALAGIIGQAAAESMAAFFTMERDVHTTEAVLKDPLGISVPTKPAAVFMMMFNALDDLVTQDDLSKFMSFIQRLQSTEMEAVFFTMLLRYNKTVRLAKTNATITDWAIKNVMVM